MAAAGLRLSYLPRSLSAVCAWPRLPSNWSPARSFGSGASAREQFLYTRPGLKSKIIDGKRIAEAVKAEVADEVSGLVSGGKRPPHLTAVIVGDDKASQIYVGNKMKAAEKCGLRATILKRDSSLEQNELLDILHQLGRDELVDGILVQLPLPPHIHEKTICNAVPPNKDVDAFHIDNIGHFCSGDPRFVPATPLGVLEIIKRLRVPTFGKNVCIANRSKNIGFTLATLLHSDGTGDATTLICHRYTPPEQLPVMTRLADIIIVATGIPGLIQADMVKDGATVIDIGITRLANNKIVGDVAFDEVCQVAGMVTPVPGGVGPLTVAMVIKNTLKAATQDFTFDFTSIHDDQ
ncbi:Bifunctional methylenetetrahydrofolate dehydrogenase/cyclohydrolase, mitochondrial [Geodia barretti]|uniref:methenyltetrahydrofolate cyclohydrolase n=1 Tax=Geodia barretti TaxID=519541 RepID=A0AA35T9Y3_GEOBA|nr:Bifunctional methylenetetrahydrofolate dehydrogenase/cyclohydrolase, mitochondrial [Geodia barretti]